MKIEDDILSRRSRLKIFSLAFLIGIIAGVVAIIFHICLYNGMNFVKQLLNAAPIAVFVLPMIVYISLYLSNRFILKDDTVFGVAALERELIYIDRFLMLPQKVIFKLLNTLIALICGFAVGQFGPTLYLGGAIGSNIGYYFKLPKAVIRALIGCGVAAAISAIMHLPLFAVVFTIEVIFAKRYFDYMLPIIIASLSAYALDSFYMGEIYLLNLHKLQTLNSLTSDNWIFIILLGLGMGLLAGIYVITLRKTSNIFRVYLSKPSFLIFLSLVFSLIYYFIPSSHYFDYERVVSLVPKEIIFLIVLLFLRLLLTSIQLASGIYGGNFSPGLILGVIFGLILFVLLPPNFSMGMDLLLIVTLAIVAMLSGFAHAPLSAVILALESSAQMSILMPALIISLISHLVSDFVAEESVFNLK